MLCNVLHRVKVLQHPDLFLREIGQLLHNGRLNKALVKDTSCVFVNVLVLELAWLEVYPHLGLLLIPLYKAVWYLCGFRFRLVMSLIGCDVMPIACMYTLDFFPSWAASSASAVAFIPLKIAWINGNG